MKFDRRDLLLTGPAALFGFQIAEALRAQGQSAAPIDSKVIDFWVHGMGVPSNTVVGGARTRGRQANGPSVSDYGREPLFLHHDAKENALLTPDQITPDKLVATGTTNVTFQLVRMRLNDADNTKFKDYSSGGIYVDLAQTTTTASTGVMPEIETLASSVFSAIFPQSGKGGSGSSTGKKSGKGNNFFRAPSLRHPELPRPLSLCSRLSRRRRSRCRTAPAARLSHVSPRIARRRCSANSSTFRRTGGLADALVSAHAFAAGRRRLDVERGAVAGGESAGSRREPAVDHDEHADRRRHHSGGRAELAGRAETASG